ncbi:DUF4440 domain-containing protein [bacterium]|jgi:hypothetical protein|nr:DUF4440 domain-containing protein [bacterium]|tara:strand:- start:6625 stop:7005 length:381 start_codon:yes stop_codon:yes gene_type:complete
MLDSMKQPTTLFNQWADALKTQDPDGVLACYAPTAVLLPTVSNTVCNTPALIRAYFVNFLAKVPVVTVLESYWHEYQDGWHHAGTYSFALSGGTTVVARFTYAYARINGEWKIIAHHSSAMPEPLL